MRSGQMKEQESDSQLAGVLSLARTYRFAENTRASDKDNQHCCTSYQDTTMLRIVSWAVQQQLALLFKIETFLSDSCATHRSGNVQSCKRSFFSLSLPCSARSARPAADKRKEPASAGRPCPGPERTYVVWPRGWAPAGAGSVLSLGLILACYEVHQASIGPKDKDTLSFLVARPCRSDRAAMA